MLLSALSTLVLVFAAAQGGPIHRDWSRHPAVVQIDTAQDIFVVGDPHGDLERLTAVLTGAKIVDGKGSWTASKAVTVFTGDLIDKGTNSLGVISMVRALQSAATQAGGQVIVTLGNHEAEFLATPEENKVAEFAGELKKAGINPTDVAACKGDLGDFLCSLPVAVRVNDWFLSHGGNTAGRSMNKLIEDLQSGIDKVGFATPQLIGDDSILEARLGDAPWFQHDGADPKQTLANYASALGVAHIVQGHQPGHVLFSDQTKRKSGEMFQRYGLIFLEDTGMSQGVNDSRGAVLRIPAGGGKAIAICFDGTATTIWDKNEKADLGKIKPCLPAGTQQAVRVLP